MPTCFSRPTKMMYAPPLMQAFLRRAFIQNLAKPQSLTRMKSASHLTEMPFSFPMKRASISRAKGLVAFVDHESKKAAIPLPPGPFKPLLEALHRLQRTTSEKGMRIRTALVTARSAPARPGAPFAHSWLRVSMLMKLCFSADCLRANFYASLNQTFSLMTKQVTANPLLQ